MKELHVSEVFELSVPERLRLVQAIWDSIEAVPEEVPVTAAERQELDRRLDAYYRDPNAGSPWPEVKAGLQL